ncbi:antibiotic biosynthesis monooxygenase [archaeon]|nr:antibiotic biosynthesis monooxygenase [archaeon]
MCIIVLVNFDVKKESVDELKKYFKEILPDTRSFEGCQGVQLYESKESPTKFIIHSKWASEDAQKKYMSWRIDTGELEKLMPMLSEHPNLEFYNIVDE